MILAAGIIVIKRKPYYKKEKIKLLNK